MVKLLVSAVVLVLLGYMGLRMSASSQSPTTGTQANTQIEKSQQDINQAVDRESQRANALNQQSQDSPGNP